MKPIVPLALAAACLAALPAQAQTDPLQVRSWAAACAGCHGTNGHAQPGHVPLAGHNKDDMLEKLLSYKQGTLPATLMHQLAKGYTDEQLAAIAEWFAQQPK